MNVQVDRGTRPTDEDLSAAGWRPFGPVGRALGRSIPLRFFVALLGVLVVSLLVAGVINLEYTKGAIRQVEQQQLSSRVEGMRVNYADLRADLLRHTRAAADVVSAIISDHVPSTRELIATLADARRSFDLDIAQILDAEGRPAAAVGPEIPPQEVDPDVIARREGRLRMITLADGRFAQAAVIPYDGVDGRRVAVGAFLLDDQLAYALRDVAQADIIVVTGERVVGSTLATPITMIPRPDLLATGATGEVELDGERKLLAYLEVMMGDGPRAWIGVVVSELSTELASDLAQGRLVMLGAIIITSLLGIAIIMRRAGLTLGRLTATAAELSRDSAGVPAPGSERAQGDEAQRISGALRDMAASIETMKEHDEAKNRFVADAAHELRNPLATISGLTETLAGHHDEIPPDVMHQSLEAIARQSTGLVDLANSLLDYTKLEGGAVDVRSERVDLGTVVARAAGSIQRPPGRTLDVDVPMGSVVIADEVHLVEIIGNLTANAYLYGGRHVWIAARREDDRFRISVNDDGDGLTAVAAERVFEPFVRAVTFGGTKGSGLGLAITKRLVEAQGGVIWYQPGSPGASFVFTLPAAP